MKDPKILIAAPIGGKKQYSIFQWFSWIANQDYQNFEVALCANGTEKENLIQKLVETEVTTVYGESVVIHKLQLGDIDKNQTVIQKITYSRELLRRFASVNNFDYILFLDTDTIPARHDTIRDLIDISKGEKVVSGLYFYKFSRVPVIVDAKTLTNTKESKLKHYAMMKKPFRAWGFGFGCVLIPYNVFSEIPFDYDLFEENRTDDFGYCELLEKAKIERLVLPHQICRHFCDTKDTRIYDVLERMNHE